jgi:predicted MFS family arabinose efflux permease
MIAQNYGWRWVFYLFGVAGLLLAAVVRTLLREVRGAPSDASEAGISMRQALRVLSGNRSYVLVTAASVCTTFTLSAIAQYTTSFLMRAHGLPLGRASLIAGIASGVIGTLGLLVLGGYVSDRVAKQGSSKRIMVCGASLLLAVGAFAGAWWTPLAVAVPLLFTGQFLAQCFPPICYATISALMPGNVRTTSIAMFSLACNLVGFGLGPVMVGAISDAVGPGLPQNAGVPIGGCVRSVADSACLPDPGYGLRVALTLALVPLLLAAFTYGRAAASLREAPAPAHPDVG